MKAKKITDAEIDGLKIASLPTRPTAPKEYGGLGYKSTDMKEAFDKLPLYAIARLNDLIDDIESEGSDSVIHSIKAGLGNGMTLGEFIEAIESGVIVSIIRFGDNTLRGFLIKMRSDLDACMDALGIGGSDGNG